MQEYPVKLIVGLGNPGPKYQGHRHNTGQWYADAVCRAWHGEWRPESRFAGEMARVNIDGNDVRLLFPTTFMNRSGQSVGAVCRYFNIEPENLLVAYDEIDYPAGTTRFRFGGGHGGHNGIRDIIQALGGQRDFYRLRIGVGHPGHKSMVANYVLTEPSRSESQVIRATIDEAVRVTPSAVSGQWQAVMRDMHTRQTD
ncbi:MAG: aminoacyl-tRNA hydrolase [Pseudomonadota bacterium]